MFKTLHRHMPLSLGKQSVVKNHLFLSDKGAFDLTLHTQVHNIRDFSLTNEALVIRLIPKGITFNLRKPLTGELLYHTWLPLLVRSFSRQ